MRSRGNEELSHSFPHLDALLPSEKIREGVHCCKRQALVSTTFFEFLRCLLTRAYSTVIFCLFQMENIGKYLKFCEEQLGVPKGDQFQTVDLYEKQNMANVSIKNNILKTKLQLKIL